MSAAEGLAGTVGGFCQGGRGHAWHHSMALSIVGGNERPVETPGGANLSAIAGGCWAWGELQQGALLRISCGAGGSEKLVVLNASA